MTPSNTYAELGDIVVVNLGILGKYGYKVTNDFLHVKLECVDNGFEYPEVFNSLGELDEFIKNNPEDFQLVPLH